jgi:integrase
MVDLLNDEQKPLASGTVNIIVCTLRHMLEQAQADKIIKTNPAEPIKKLPEKQKKIELLKLDEVRKLFPADWESVWRNPYIYLINKLAASTGMRMGEILGLKGAAVFPAYIRVEKQFTKEKNFTETKTKKERDVPITERIYNELQDIIRLNGDGFIFSENGGKTPIPRSTLYDGTNAAFDAVGIGKEERESRGITFHAWRHFFITYMRMGNVTDKKARDVAGHSSAIMSDHYTHMDTKEFDEVRDLQDNLLIGCDEAADTGSGEKKKKKAA